MYAIGNNLSMHAVKKFMSLTWNFVTLPELYYNEEGYFLVRFKTRLDRDAVLMRGPYTVFKKPILLHEWTPKFTLQDDVLRVLPIWVIFPQLPLYCWGEHSIGKIANAIGKPLLTDECTSKKLRVSYARVLIEVDVTKQLRTHITIRDPQGEKMLQQVEYEWTPPYCTVCNKVGHVCKQTEAQARKKKEGKQAWEQKKPQEKQAEPTVNVPKGTEQPKPDHVETEVPKPTEMETEVPWTVVQNRSRGKAPQDIQVENNNILGGLHIGEGSQSTGVT
ncbi:uncharacterized protein LOC131595094 [Vicia villosa]|uniref:uncharacterized protein LOC131595094 n=1 Tax=Vicia villosa TaxID=3911 RepID=UPI00273CE818|nr:uncharacterized protein LOC131595094 [Vicia villosa]